MEHAQPHAKRKRLSHACTRCRSKKVRCDELQPRCSNCVRANVGCETFDPRTLAAVQRREAQSLPAAASPSVATNSGWRDAEKSATPQAPVPLISEDIESPAETSPLLPVLPRFLNGNSLSVLTQWLDLAFARLGIKQRLHRTYKQISFNEKRPNYSTLDGDSSRAFDLPQFAQAASKFSESLGWIAPVFKNVPFDSLATSQLNADTHVSTPLQALMQALILVTGASNSMALAERYFSYAYRRLPAILEEVGALDSIRAFLLMSLYLYWREDVEKALQILSLAVLSLQNHSLHRDTRSPLPVSKDLFWSVFVLDKILSIELERRPMLCAADCNIKPPGPPDGPHEAIFNAVVGLSKLQDEILEKMQLSRRAEEEAHEKHTPINQVIKNKLRLVGELDQKLLRFADDLPHGLKPTEYLYADLDSLPGLTFLAVQYYQTVFLVSRNALLINMEGVQSEVDRSFEAQPCNNRLKSGINVCTNAARSILNILNHAAEMKVRSPLSTPYAPLMAMYALTIHIVRRQSPSTARVDLELQATAMNLIKEFYSAQPVGDNDEMRKGAGLLQMLERLHHFSESFISRAVQPQTARPDTCTSANGHPTGLNNERRLGSSFTRAMSPPQSPANQLNSSIGATVNDTTPNRASDDPASTQAIHPFPLSDFGDDLLLDMGQDLAIDWDELAVALGLPGRGG